MKTALKTRFFMNSLENRDRQCKKWAKATLQKLQTQTNIGIVSSIFIREFYKVPAGRGA
jgi:hypothetical protein